MTKVELVRAICKKTGVEQPIALACVEAAMETIKETMVNGENIYLRGFGTFDLKQRAQKTARNISKNTTLVIPPHKVPHFKPCKEFVEQVAK